MGMFGEQVGAAARSCQRRLTDRLAELGCGCHQWQVNGVLLFLGLLASSLIFAAWLGAAPERIASALYLLAIIGSAAVGGGSAPGDGFRQVDAMLLGVDAAMAVALTWLSIRANRLWPIIASACQWLAVLGHVVRWLASSIIPTSYAFLAMVWSWPMVALLLGGTIAHQWRRRVGRPIPDWRPS